MWLNFNNSCTYTIGFNQNMLLRLQLFIGAPFQAWFENTSCSQTRQCAFRIIEVGPVYFIIKSDYTGYIVAEGDPLSSTVNDAIFTSDPYLDYDPSMLFRVSCPNTSAPGECYILRGSYTKYRILTLGDKAKDTCNTMDAVFTSLDRTEVPPLLFWENCGDRAGSCDTTTPFYPIEYSAEASAISVLGAIGITGILMLCIY